jgi:hypothetical protein
VELGLDDNQSALIAAKELLALLSFRKKATRRVQADADSLIAGFGDAAFNVARERAQRSAMIDGDRPRGHWTRVKIEIAKRQGIKIARRKLTRSSWLARRAAQTAEGGRKAIMRLKCRGHARGAVPMGRRSDILKIFAIAAVLPNFSRGLQEFCNAT